MTPLEFCEKYLENYTINPDNTIDVNGNVNLYFKLGNMEKLPVKFGKVSCDFDCYGNNLTTLEGCPDYVGGDFDCRKNNLTTLEGCPKYIDEHFGCNILTHHILGNIQGSIFTNTKQRIVI
jgi:hypothetical protein